MKEYRSPLTPLYGFFSTDMRFLLGIILAGGLIASRLAYIRFLLRAKVKCQPLLCIHVIYLVFGWRLVN